MCNFFIPWCFFDLVPFNHVNFLFLDASLIWFPFNPVHFLFLDASLIWVPFNPFTAILAIWKMANKSAKFEITKASFSLCMSTWQDFCQNAQYWK